MHHIVYNTLQHKKKSSSTVAVTVWVVGVGATTSRLAVELISLWVNGVRCMKKLHRLKNLKNEWKWRSWKTLMIGARWPGRCTETTGGDGPRRPGQPEAVNRGGPSLRRWTDATRDRGGGWDEGRLVGGRRHTTDGCVGRACERVYVFPQRKLLNFCRLFFEPTKIIWANESLCFPWTNGKGPNGGTWRSGTGRGIEREDLATSARRQCHQGAEKERVWRSAAEEEHWHQAPPLAAQSSDCRRWSVGVGPTNGVNTAGRSSSQVGARRWDLCREQET
jgi:hypothetical protein